MVCDPQRGQATPFGQRIFSRYFRHLRPLLNLAWSSTRFMVRSLLLHDITERTLSQVYNPDPSSVLGKPDGNDLSLGGPSGYVSVRMGKTFTDGQGVDLRVYEAHGIKEPFDVFISSDNVTWIRVATSIEDDSGEDYASVDIGLEAGPGTYRYVKVVDKSTRSSGDYPGSDIDAIEVLWSP